MVGCPCLLRDAFCLLFGEKVPMKKKKNFETPEFYTLSICPSKNPFQGPRMGNHQHQSPANQLTD